MAGSAASGCVTRIKAFRDGVAPAALAALRLRARWGMRAGAGIDIVRDWLELADRSCIASRVSMLHVGARFVPASAIMSSSAPQLVPLSSRRCISYIELSAAATFL